MELGRHASHAPPRSSVPELTPGIVNRECVLSSSILIALQAPSLGLMSRVLGGRRAPIHPQRGSLIQHPARARFHNHRRVRMDIAVQMVESTFRLKLQQKHPPCLTGLPKDTSHVETLPLALHGHPRTLPGVAQHQEN
jgi:hypothetical protein